MNAIQKSSPGSSQRTVQYQAIMIRIALFLVAALLSIAATEKYERWGALVLCEKASGDLPRAKLVHGDDELEVITLTDGDKCKSKTLWAYIDADWDKYQNHVDLWWGGHDWEGLQSFTQTAYNCSNGGLVRVENKTSEENVMKVRSRGVPPC